MKLKTWLTANGITQASLSRATGVDVATVSRIISGKQEATLTAIAKFAAATGGQVSNVDFDPVPPLTRFAIGKIVKRPQPYQRGGRKLPRKCNELALHVRLSIA